MKLPTFLSVLTILLLLGISPRILGQCHGGAASTKEHSDNSNKSSNPPETVTNSDEIIFYDCPMHAEIKSLKPGTCSKCGMNLELKKANVFKSEQQKDSVYYTCSMHPEVKETKPGNCPKCGMELIKKSSIEASSNESNTKFSFKVSGNCGMCKTRIEKAAKSVKGVLSAEWDEETKIITIGSENKSPEAKAVSDAITAAGYDTEYAIAKDEAYNKLHGCCKYEREKK